MGAFLRPVVAAVAVAMPFGSILRFTADANKGPGGPQARPVPHALKLVIGPICQRLDGGTSAGATGCRAIATSPRSEIEPGLRALVQELVTGDVRAGAEDVRFAP